MIVHFFVELCMRFTKNFSYSQRRVSLPASFTNINSITFFCNLKTDVVITFCSSSSVRLLKVSEHKSWAVEKLPMRLKQVAQVLFMFYCCASILYIAKFKFHKRQKWGESQPWQLQHSSSLSLCGFSTPDWIYWIKKRGKSIVVKITFHRRGVGGSEWDVKDEWRFVCSTRMIFMSRVWRDWEGRKRTHCKAVFA